METVIYADVLFLINFSMDFIALSAAASLGAIPKKALRLCLAAGLGAIYGVSATVSGLPAALQTALAFLVCLSMCFAAFGGCGGILRFLRQCLIFFGCSALLGGIMTAVLSHSSTMQGKNLPVLIVSSAVVVYFIISAVRERKSAAFARVSVTVNEATASFEALCDSGNLLREPFSKKPVILASRHALTKLFDKETLDSIITCSPSVLLRGDLKPRLIPQKTANSSSLICAVCPKKTVISAGKRTLQKDCYIGIIDCPENHFGGYAATLPTILLP